MTKPTPEQIQRACDLANGPNDATPWFPGHYGDCTVITALADTIAKLDAMQAERDKARADLGEIYIQLDGVSGLHRLADDSRQAIEAAHDTAATYRVETDPLVEALVEIQLSAFLAGRGSVSSMKHGTLTASHAPTIDTWRKIACSTLDAYEPELAKRGLEIGRAA